MVIRQKVNNVKMSSCHWVFEIYELVGKETLWRHKGIEGNTRLLLIVTI